MELLVCIATLLVVFVVYKLLDYLLRLPTIDQYSKRYILVAGCDSGLGKAFVQRLDGLGCHVFAGCLTEAGKLELSNSCSERIQSFILDVAKHDSVLRALDFVQSRLPPGNGLWAVVNSAGSAFAIGPEEWLTIADYQETLNVNLYGMIDVTMTFLPLIKKSRGRIVNVGSIGGRTAVKFATAYNVSKYGIEAFTDNLRRSLRLFSCKAIIIESGAYRSKCTSSENLRENFTRVWNKTSSAIKQEFGEDYFHGCLKFADEYYKRASTNITPHVDACQHAVFGRFPRARYVVGLDARFFLLPLTYLPEWLSDAILGNSRNWKTLPAALIKKRE